MRALYVSIPQLGQQTRVEFCCVPTLCSHNVGIGWIAVKVAAGVCLELHDESASSFGLLSCIYPMCCA